MQERRCFSNESQTQLNLLSSRIGQFVFMDYLVVTSMCYRAHFADSFPPFDCSHARHGGTVFYHYL